jgi:hypothetical protein
MSVHAKRAAVAVALVTMWTVVRVGRPLVTALTAGGTASGGLGAASFGPGQALVVLVFPALLVWVLTYLVSRVGWPSVRGPIARR